MTVKKRRRKGGKVTLHKEQGCFNKLGYLIAIRKHIKTSTYTLFLGDFVDEHGDAW